MSGKNPYQAQAEARVGQSARGKWRLDRVIDVGGMAAVYAATHRNGNRVAIKVLHKAYASHDQAKERFLREGYVANKVGHANAVSVMDDGQLDDSTPFIVMELLEGETLEDRLKAKKTLGHVPVAYIADRVLDVLVAAHDKSIVHRDIKPANIFLTSDGATKVLDFGLARLREHSFAGGSMTRTGMVIGTASYMAPEQARGKHNLVDYRTDLWAVGATMFRALTGRYVHSGETVNERLIKAMSEHAPAIRSIAPHVPSPLADVIDCALMFQKGDRFDDARKMQKALLAAYEAVEHEALPNLARMSQVEGWDDAPPVSRQRDDSMDVHISVVFSEEAAQRSIIIDFEDPEGPSERVVLRRHERPEGEDDDDEITEVSVLEHEPTGRQKP